MDKNCNLSTQKTSTKSEYIWFNELNNDNRVNSDKEKAQVKAAERLASEVFINTFNVALDRDREPCKIDTTC